ncbi:aldehyde dehydrogenase family protein [Streptomyces malaysiensis subsp. malaysiensis]
MRARGGPHLHGTGRQRPFIVFEDADLDTAVEGAMTAKMRNMGEACTAANRFFVHSSVAAEFADRLARRMGALEVGPGSRPGVDVGPLIDRAGRTKVEELVADAVARGAEVLVGGSAPDGPGCFYPPTVLTGVSPASRLMETEIFGPVAAVLTFDDEDEVVATANHTEWGLVGYVFTQDLGRSLRVSERLEVGMVGLNTGLVSNPAAPFGGVKQSGLGREGGRVGIDEFLEYKYVAVPV